MNIENNIASVADVFDLNSLDKIPKKEADKAKAIASQFSSIFVNEMLQTARKTKLCDDDGFFNSDQTKMSQKLYYQELSQKIGGSDSFGILQLIEYQINKKE